MSDPAKVSKITTTDGVAHEINATTVNDHTVAADVPSTAIFTDEKVTQTATTTNANYEVLFSNSANNFNETAGVRKDSNLIYNPNTHEIHIKDHSSGGLFMGPNYIDYLESSTGEYRFNLADDQILLTHLSSTDDYNNYKMKLTGYDIKLSGASGNTWDGTNRSLKTVLQNVANKDVAVKYMDGGASWQGRFTMGTSIFYFTSGVANVNYSHFGISTRPEILVLTAQSQRCGVQYDFDGSSSKVRICLVGNTITGNGRVCWICVRGW